MQNDVLTIPKSDEYPDYEVFLARGVTAMEDAFDNGQPISKAFLEIQRDRLSFLFEKMENVA